MIARLDSVMAGFRHMVLFDKTPDVCVVMGSQSNWPTMRHACEILEELEVRHATGIVSAHRTPGRLYDFARNARSKGIQVIIAGAGGAAHLPGMISALTTLPVLGVPVESKALKGLDSLLSIVQMPGGVPTPTFAIGPSGAKNAALTAVSILSLRDQDLAARYNAWRQKQTDSVAETPHDHD